MRKVALIILDGWGIGEPEENNAIHKANTPFFDYLWSNFPRTQLQASGEYVGLPEGQIGGSEVGHLTIGAGRVIYQQLPRINRAFLHKDTTDGILNNPVFEKVVKAATDSPLHLIGLISTGGVHSHEAHLHSLLEILQAKNVQTPTIHFISDGRDTPPRSGIESAKLLGQQIAELGFGTVATLSGRFYAMDRDNNMDRTGKAVDLYLRGKNSEVDHYSNLEQGFQVSYSKDVTDEFIEPAVIGDTFEGIKDGEPILFFNFRSDRMKQLITSLNEKLPNSPIYTMTQYDKSYNFPVLFEKHQVKETLGEILAQYNLKQLRASETEKFPHVTYFFNGGVEIVFDGEIRKAAESNKVKHDEIPEMKAKEITEQVNDIVHSEAPEFILVNFANPDMVGHTGNFDAVVKGVETVDSQLKTICDLLSPKDYIVCVTADHGNADIMYDLVTKEPHTAHTLNPVPFIIYDANNPANQSLKLDQSKSNGLSMVAGTVLDLMDVPGLSHQFETLIVS